MCNWQDCCSELCCLLQKMDPSSQFHCVYPSCPPTHPPAFTAYIIWRQLPHPGLQACGSSRTVILFHGHIYWFKDRWTHNSIRANKVTEDGRTLLVQKLSLFWCSGNVLRIVGGLPQPREHVVWPEDKVDIEKTEKRTKPDPWLYHSNNLTLKPIWLLNFQDTWDNKAIVLL